MMDWGPWHDYNQADLLLLHGWSHWTIAALLAGAGLVWLLTLLDLRRLKLKRGLTLLLLRSLALSLALLAILEPALELRQVQRERNHILVLVDGSDSMTLPAMLNLERRQIAAGLIKELAEYSESWREDHLSDYFLFGGDLRSSSPGELIQGNWQGPEPQSTDILGAFKQAVESIGRQEIAAVLILSDGSDRSSLSQKPSDELSINPQIAREFSAIGAPIHTLAIGQKQLADLSITQVLHDDFAFVRNRVRFEVQLESVGLANQATLVELWQGGTRIATKRLAITKDRETLALDFEVVPERIGTEVYSIIAVPLEQEKIRANNAQHFTLKIVRDKIRVLQVCGRPSWDERFLRRFLKEKANVDLISFFILRTQSDIQVVPESQMALIPFPKHELFSEELAGFDLLIFQNFNFAPYDVARYLNNIRKFVHDGGGFVMVGGGLSFGLGGYSNTPIAELLPVELRPRPHPHEADGQDYHLKLNPAGSRHPLARLALSPAESARQWAALPPWRGLNQILNAKANTTTIAVHESLQTPMGMPQPMIVAGSYGQGRTLAIMSDSSWRWAFQSRKAGGTARAYDNFWSNALRWLVKDPELKTIDITPPENVAPGAQAQATISVLSYDYQPRAKAKVMVKVVRHPFARDWEKATTLFEESLLTDEAGLARLTLPTDLEGAYAIYASTQEDGLELSDQDLFLVHDDSPERRQVAANTGLLEAISLLTGGRHYNAPLPQGALEDLPLKAPTRTTISRMVTASLWDSPWGLVFLTCLLAADWLLRRRWGYH